MGTNLKCLLAQRSALHLDRIYGREQETINKSMRPSVGGKYITSLFCSVLKCGLMLSIKRAINSASAEIIDGSCRWRHWLRLELPRMMQFPFRFQANFREVIKVLCRLLTKLFVPDRLTSMSGYYLKLASPLELAMCQHEKENPRRWKKGVNKTIIRNY